MSRAARARVITLVGYLGIWGLLPVWQLWLGPSEPLPPYIMAALLAPLVFPLKGLLAGRPYTYAWSTLVALIYFGHGVGEAWTLPQERICAGMEIILSTLWFAGAIAYVRATAR